ncbi:hypothetical protein CYMTET_17213 [Cymbomonas tetramitiformis]|uniref:Uncharacterized protein n=1 Tax=Cymbomonas tetramitiformis TaxID=36881 RepID=A0AAE0GAC4_9CHLO|nr:hypothetical protein CYMTET_17213 [Cymbomonas tetramitiformis]
MLQPAQPLYPAPPPTAPALGPQHPPLVQPPTPDHRPLFQGARADAWYEPSVEEYAQRLEGTWREWAQPEGSQQSASSVGLRAGDQLTQQSPVPSGVLEAIVDGPVTYNGAGASAVSAAIPSPSPPASRSPSLSHNRQVHRYWHDCLKEQWRGLHVWCNPPYSSSHLTIEAVLRKYVEEWRSDPDNTSTVFVLPDLQSRIPAWRKLFRMEGMRIVEVIPTHNSQREATQLFESPDGRLLDLPWPVLVVYAPPSRSQPARVRHPRAPQPVLRSGSAARLRDAGSVQQTIGNK